MKALTLLAAATAASAHTIFVQLEADGTRYPVSHGVRTPQYDGPITDVSSNDLACNGGPNPTMKTDKIITVTAGSTVKAIWRHTLQSGPNDVMDPSHKGPTLAYLKKVDNALTDSGVGGGWFKIQEDGHSNGNWGTLKVINNQGIHYIDIPDCIESGQYLLRAEMIALHAAGSPGGAQLYMECAQIEIVGGKGTVKPQTYSIPGIYKSNDPGILINIYSMSPSSQYIIPGPPLFTCNGGGGSNNGGGNNGGSNPPVQQPPATTLTTAIAQPTPICSVQQWGQCGGQGYSGCTTCASPYRCNEINAWYSQCL